MPRALVRVSLVLLLSAVAGEGLFRTACCWAAAAATTDYPLGSATFRRLAAQVVCGRAFIFDSIVREASAWAVGPHTALRYRERPDVRTRTPMCMCEWGSGVKGPLGFAGFVLCIILSTSSTMAIELGGKRFNMGTLSALWPVECRVRARLCGQRGIVRQISGAARAFRQLGYRQIWPAAGPRLWARQILAPCKTPSQYARRRRRRAGLPGFRCVNPTP